MVVTPVALAARIALWVPGMIASGCSRGSLRSRLFQKSLSQ